MSNRQPPDRVARRCLRTRSCVLLAALALLVLPACHSTRTDPSYNRYCPNNGDPTLLERGESCIDTAEEILNNVDERAEQKLF